MPREKIARILREGARSAPVQVKGWVRTRRDSKTFSFLEINDGSCLSNLQVIADESLPDYEEIKTLSTGSAMAVTGPIVESPGGKQNVEMKAEAVEILSRAPDDYPLQKKRHTDEFLRTIAHLRPRTNKYGAAFRIRSELAQAIHAYFRERDFRYIHTPIITASDCEGAGEMFRVTTFDGSTAPVSEGETDYAKDFFGAPAYLTVSGQLAVEMFALSLGDVYTFGPTFRSENSNTRRHAAEFWMIEPEMAFCDLNGDMNLAENFIREMVRHIRTACAEDLNLFARFVDKTLNDRLEMIAEKDYVRMSHADAVALLEKSGRKFEFPVHAKMDLQAEHERFLTEEYAKAPVIVHDYPKEVKAFYMRLNDDGETVRAMDVLVPGIGEIIGGSQREERYDVLKNRMVEAGLPVEEYGWYLDSRRFGTVEHSEFGLGFERFLMLITGIQNIRDVVPYPRTPGAITF